MFPVKYPIGQTEPPQSPRETLPTMYDLPSENPEEPGLPDEFHAEPELGLASGDDGLDFTRRLLTEAADFLTEDGLLVVEVGNSWPALEAAYPALPFTWVEFERGGHGVFVLAAQELRNARMAGVLWANPIDALVRQVTYNRHTFLFIRHWILICQIKPNVRK